MSRVREKYIRSTISCIPHRLSSDERLRGLRFSALALLYLLRLETRLVRSRLCERDESLSDSDSDPEEESESELDELESDSEPDDESESVSDDDDELPEELYVIIQLVSCPDYTRRYAYRFLRFREGSPPFDLSSLARAFSFSSRILSAVPALFNLTT